MAGCGSARGRRSPGRSLTAAAVAPPACLFPPPFPFRFGVGGLRPGGRMARDGSNRPGRRRLRRRLSVPTAASAMWERCHLWPFSPSLAGSVPGQEGKPGPPLGWKRGDTGARGNRPQIRPPRQSNPSRRSNRGRSWNLPASKDRVPARRDECWP